MSSEEAEKFWPIYNEYAKRNQEIIFKKNKLKELVEGNEYVEKLTKERATIISQQFIDFDSKVLHNKKVLYHQLKEIISDKKIIKLYIAESDFNRQLLVKLRRELKN